MKLNEVYSKTLEEVIKDLTLVDIKVHNSGDELQSIELKYSVEPTDKTVQEKGIPPWR